jgi:hypothetical protein
MFKQFEMLSGSPARIPLASQVSGTALSLNII